MPPQPTSVAAPPSGLIVLGGSAGSVGAITTVVAGLPADLPAAVLVVIHIAPEARSALPRILERAGPLPARHPDGEEPLTRGTILVAPPDRHLLVRDGHAIAFRGPHENRTRPSIDVTLRSAARWWGARAVGVVLSGTLRDGTAGLQVLVRAGGAAIVQDPDEALFTGMPESALEATDAEVLPVALIAGRLDEISRGWLTAPAQEGAPGMEDKGAALDWRPDAEATESGASQPSSMGCPECGGVLWERHDGTGFVCRVGHGYAAEDLASAQKESVEAALWSAIRALEENRELNDRLARRTALGRSGAAQLFTDRAARAADHAEVLRGLVLRESA